MEIADLAPFTPAAGSYFSDCVIHVCARDERVRLISVMVQTHLRTQSQQCQGKKTNVNYASLASATKGIKRVKCRIGCAREKTRDGALVAAPSQETAELRGSRVSRCD